MPEFFKLVYRKLLFTQMSGLVHRARTHIIQSEDIPPCPPELDPRQNSLWRQIPQSGGPVGLLWSVAKLNKNLLIPAVLVETFCWVLSVLNPVLIHQFIDTLQTNASLQLSLFWGTSLALVSLVRGVIFQHYFHNMLRTEQRITNDLSELVYRKSLNLSLSAKARYPIGDIVNYMSVDTDSVSEYLFHFNDLVFSGLTILTVAYELYHYVGPKSIYVLAFLFLIFPVVKNVSKRFVKADEEMMGFRDQRVTLMGQILNSIRLIKAFAWEMAITQEVNSIRDKEVSARKRLIGISILSASSLSLLNMAALSLSIGISMWNQTAVNVTLVFTTISIFGLLEEPLASMSRIISHLSQSFVSARRLLDFFKVEEWQRPTFSPTLSPGNAVEFENASVTLNGRAILKDLNFSVAQGEAIAVIGPVGGGKSTLLMALLGEVQLQGGHRRSSKSYDIAFVSQEAFLINGSLRENLLFGIPEGRSDADLHAALRFASFWSDFLQLPAGLQTEIGEKGINLSGGQKQRVCLARAFLTDAEMLLLDDPLSAVDPDTEAQLCDQLLFGPWAKKTRIVVTHRLNPLRRFDRVLFLNQGKVVAFEPFEQIQKNSEFQDFYSHFRDDSKSEVQALQAAAGHHEQKDASSPEESRITIDEDREKGAVKSSIYFNYLLSMGGQGSWAKVILGIVAITAILASLLPLLQRYWLTNSTANDVNLHYLLIGFGVIGLFAWLTSLLNEFMWLHRGTVAAQNFHSRMLHGTLHANTRFFDSTPVGRILQRFSRDLEGVDMQLLFTFESFINCLTSVFVTLGLLIVAIPWMLLVIAPASLLYFRLQNDYRRPARELKRLDSIARSPRFAHFKETLTGLSVIRSFKRESLFLQMFLDKLANSQKMFYAVYMTNRWFSTRVPILATGIAFFTLTCVSYFRFQGWISAGTGGLLTTYSLSFWGLLNWAVRAFSDIESRMTSVERLRFYGNLPSEPGFAMVSAKLPRDGELELIDVKVRYASHLPLVLKGVTAKIPAGSRVGVIGRTGSGKTTLFQTLFRFVEPESGKILIGGVDAAFLSLEDLRTRLAIVPQDPTLLIGTIRTNLDRYEKFADAELWSVLESVGLKKFVESLPTGMLSAIQESGLNLSQGQRQLLCLARALLVRAQLVLMDEATASVDIETDHHIQKVLREKFAGITILMIAHRLSTLEDCDLILKVADGTSEVLPLSQAAKMNLEAVGIDTLA